VGGSGLGFGGLVLCTSTKGEGWKQIAEIILSREEEDHGLGGNGRITYAYY